MKKYYFAIFKPFDMLSQFTGDENASLLGDLYNFPKDVYSIGRLDKTSEGLLLLTNDNEFKNKVLDPKNKLTKTYYVQVDHDITPAACKALSEGKIKIKHNGKQHQVATAKCQKINEPDLPERSVPIRFRKEIPTSWISLTLKEGKNRQVRKMTAAVGFPTLRLVRYSVGNFTIDNMKPGDVVEIHPNEVIPNWM
ncbi:pseudouridine synthase [Brumimicrobium aurantiacum]|uniref:Pseudouridine synthase n=1 Tax=Brumimicrobium aurantiacum TaxID=1737063 RepID=A0A3E1EZH3_9FLAO|nr:pseudouridine synthase [Brumimicrobium aurantiacum]RFC54954.1 pseudouridine synthase [Brumimicrobium aurantiacum]